MLNIALVHSHENINFFPILTFQWEERESIKNHLEQLKSPARIETFRVWLSLMLHRASVQVDHDLASSSKQFRFHFTRWNFPFSFFAQKLCVVCMWEIINQSLDEKRSWINYQICGYQKNYELCASVKKNMNNFEKVKKPTHALNTQSNKIIAVMWNGNQSRERERN